MSTATRRGLFILLLCCLPLAALATEHFGYRVTDRKPQSTDNYVQGLKIVDGNLYVSSGGYGNSHLRRYRFADGSLEQEYKLDRRIFAEGLTIFEDKLYQLTWHNRMVLVYDRDSFEPSEWFPIPGEGWGLTNNGAELIYSDGSDKLHFMSPTGRHITRSISVRENGKPVIRLNELEWIDGRIWANVWMTDRIVIIDPVNGEVTASVDLSGLQPLLKNRSPNDVLNGIARDPRDGSIWVTGKRWPWLYQIELVSATAPN